MKNIILLLVVLSSVQVMASRARILALGTPMHLVDYQFMALNPIFIHMPNAVILESGLTTSTNSRNNAEGMVVYGLEDKSRIAVALGKNDELYMNSRVFMNSIVGAGTYSVPQNAVHAFYGNRIDNTTFSVGLSYSNFDDKVNSVKESTAGIVGSVKYGPWVGFGSYSFVNSAEAAGSKKFEGAGTLRAAGRYLVDDLTYGVDIATWTAKSSTASVENESYGFQQVMARVISSTKKDGSDLFYGAGLSSTTINCDTRASADCSTKFSRLVLPILIGIEVNASEFLTIRGSITQSAVLNSTKDEIGLPATSGIAGANGSVSDFGSAGNNTTIAGGIGIKVRNMIIDGTMATATNQKIDTSNFISQVALTYNF